MKIVPDLNLGSIDAVNYKQRSEKEFLSKILYREAFLDEIIDASKYFLIGEKGTGKTSYAVFLQNSEYRNNRAKIINLSATDYRKFVSLKKLGKFQVSNYVDVWKTIILLLTSDMIREKKSFNPINFIKFQNLGEAIDQYYNNAFKPEVDYSLEMIVNSEVALKFIIGKMAELSGKEGNIEKITTSNFQMSLMGLQRAFEEAITSLKLNENLILFIDGIDIRPDKIEYADYIECIQGLSNAVWELNTEFFANIKDSPGRIKTVLLMRPDILDHMDFQNLNGKVRDNGVVLNWQTSFDQFRTSSIFALISGMLAKQQKEVIDKNEAWDHYFQYDTLNLQVSEKFDNPFIGLLRYSFHRPRDIVQYLQLMQDYVRRTEVDKTIFSRDSFYKSQGIHSDYLLGEVKDYLSFYYPISDFDDVVGFFSQLNGRSEFTWAEFERAHQNHKRTIQAKNISIEEIRSTPEEMLQFLYALNIIGYVEKTTEGSVFVHYCFRDRTPTKLRPRVKLGLSYSIHPGLARALLVKKPASRKF